MTLIKEEKIAQLENYIGEEKRILNWCVLNEDKCEPGEIEDRHNRLEELYEKLYRMKKKTMNAFDVQKIIDDQIVINNDDVLDLLNGVKDGSITPEEAQQALNLNDRIDVPDIRNKLSPITHLLTVLEMDDDRFKKLIPYAIKNVKRVVNYLAKRSVYEK